MSKDLVEKLNNLPKLVEEIHKLVQSSDEGLNKKLTTHLKNVEESVQKAIDMRLSEIQTQLNQIHAKLEGLNNIASSAKKTVKVKELDPADQKLLEENKDSSAAVEETNNDPQAKKFTTNNIWFGFKFSTDEEYRKNAINEVKEYIPDIVAELAKVKDNAKYKNKTGEELHKCEAGEILAKLKGIEKADKFRDKLTAERKKHNEGAK